MEITDLNGRVKLSNGVKIPYLGLGAFKTLEGVEIYNSVRWALDTGYRHIDTASIYGNEKGIGKAIKASGIPRDQIFITSKAWNENQRSNTVMQGFEKSLEDLDTDYVDLYLIHWPVKEKIKSTWKIMEEIYHSGRAKAIGVSNFLEHHLNEIFEIAEISPMVNQVECHPYLTQQPLYEFCKMHQIIMEAWSPIMRGQVNQLPLLNELAEKYHKTPVQIVLRWDLQRGIVTIPKSVHKDRIISNTQLFDFELSPDDISRINSLDQDKRYGSHPDTFTF